MSERGSFVTQYIYCDRCFSAAYDELVVQAHDGQLFMSSQVGSLPIIAGKAGGWGPGDELCHFDELVFALSKRICHDMRLVVIAEASGERVYLVRPGGGYDYRTICVQSGDADD